MRPTPRSSLSLLLAAGLAVGACGGGDDREAPSGSTSTSDGSPTASTTTSMGGGGSTSTTTAPRSFAGAAGAVDAWFAALGEGDLDEAWALLHPASQAVYGDRAGFEGARSELAEGYGSWSRATDVTSGTVPLTQVAPDLAVVVLRGTVTREGMTERAATAVPVRVGPGGEALVDPFRQVLDAGVIEFVPPSGATVDGRTLRARVPTAVEVLAIVDDRGAVEPTVEGAGTGHKTVAVTPAVALEPGDHTFTVVAVEGEAAQARAARYTVGG